MDLEPALLHVISQHDGELGWYRLARKGQFSRPPACNDLFSELDRLELAGLIKSRPAGDGHERYCITSKGRARLRKLSAQPATAQHSL